MKRLGLLFLLTLTLSAQAQEKTASSNDNMASTDSATLWMTGGLAFSSLTNQGTEVTSARTGMAFGAEYELPLTSNYSVQAGVDYLQKGDTVDVASPNVSGTFVANYFEIPVLLRVNLPVKANRISFLAGPYAAFAVSRSLRLGSETTDLGSATKSMDYGLRFGAAYTIPLCDMLTSTFGLNYDLGLQNINDAFGGVSMNTRSLIVAVGVGYKF